MRCIRDEIATHLLNPVHIRHIMRDQNLTPVFEGDETNNQLALIQFQSERLVVTSQNDVVNEFRAAYQVGDTHALVLGHTETEMLLGNRITPFKEENVIHDDDTVRQLAHGLTKTRKPLSQLIATSFVITTQTVQFGEDLCPGSPAIAQTNFLRLVKPERQLVHMPQLHDHQQCEHNQGNGEADGQIPHRPASQSGSPNQNEPNKYRNPKQRARRHAKKELFFGKHVAYTTNGLDEEIGPTEGLA